MGVSTEEECVTGVSSIAQNSMDEHSTNEHSTEDVAEVVKRLREENARLQAENARLREVVRPIEPAPALMGRSQSDTVYGEKTSLKSAAVYDNDEIMDCEINGKIDSATAVASPRLKYAFHFLLCEGYFGLGVVLCMVGPTLLDLSEQVGHASVREMTVVFTSRSLSYLIGAIVGGFLIEKIENPCKMLAFSTYIVVVGSAGLPLCTQIWAMCCCMACAGISMGLLDTAANVVTLRLWGADTEPFMQSLHASFAVGALVAPLIAERFISHGRHTESVTVVCDGNASNVHRPTVEPVTALSGGSGGDVTWAFWIASLLMMPSALGLTVLISRWSSISVTSGKHVAVAAVEETEKDVAGTGTFDTQKSKSNVTYQWTVLGLGLFIFALYVGAEIGFGGFIFSFSVSACALQFSESKGAFLTAVYWATFTAGRLLAIPLSVKFSSKTLAAVDVGGCLVAALLLLAIPQNEAVVWSATALFGLSLASIFASTFMMLERIISMSGRAASAIMVGSAAGEMAMPLAIGYFFDQAGPETFPVINAVVSVVGAFVFLILFRVA